MVNIKFRNMLEPQGAAFRDQSSYDRIPLFRAIWLTFNKTTAKLHHKQLLRADAERFQIFPVICES